MRTAIVGFLVLLGTPPECPGHSLAGADEYFQFSAAAPPDAPPDAPPGKPNPEPAPPAPAAGKPRPGEPVPRPPSDKKPLDRNPPEKEPTEKEPPEKSPPDKEPRTEPTPGSDPKVARYIEVLDHDNPLVRKHAITILERMGPVAVEATPAVFELRQKERDAQVRKKADRFLAGEQFSITEKVDAFLKCLQDPKQPTARRALSCRALTAFYLLSKQLEGSQRVAIRDGLEGAVAAKDEDVQVAAARALEGISQVGVATLRQRIPLDPNLLRTHKLTTAAVLRAVQELNARWKVELAEPTVLQITLTSPEEVLLLEELPVRESSDGLLLLRDIWVGR